MRVLVVLVLTLFVGCNASSFNADRPTSKLNELIWTIEDIGEASFREVERISNHIMTKTEPGIYWNARLNEFFEQRKPYIDAAWKQIPQEAKDLVKVVTRGTFTIIRRVNDEVNNFKNIIEPIFEQAAFVAEGIAAELTDEVELVKNFASSYVTWLELHVQEYLATLKPSDTPQQ